MKQLAAATLVGGMAVASAWAQYSRVWTHPTVPAPQVLDRLNLWLGWRSGVPIEGYRDGIATWHATFQTAVPGQVPDVDSVLLGTAGVAVAHLAVVPGYRYRLRRRRERLRGATPRIPRVGLAPQADVFSGSRTYL